MIDGYGEAATELSSMVSFPMVTAAGNAGDIAEANAVWKIWNTEGDQLQDIALNLSAIAGNSFTVSLFDRILTDCHRMNNYRPLWCYMVATTEGSTRSSESKFILSLYCSRWIHNIDARKFAANYFLTYQTVKLITGKRVDFLSFMALSDNYGTSTDFAISGTVEYIDTTLGDDIRTMDSITIYRGKLQYGEMHTVAISSDGIKGLIATLGNSYEGAVKLLSLTVADENNHNRRMEYFFVDDKDIMAFYYRNCFGRFELIEFPATCDTEIDKESKTGMIGGKYREYDAEITKTFNIQTGILSRDLVEMIDQMMDSEEVYLADDYNAISTTEDLKNLRRIIITDIDYAPTDASDGSKTNNVAFSFRFEKPNTILAVATGGRVHTNPFELAFN